MKPLKPIKVLEDKKHLYYAYNGTVYKIAKNKFDKNNLLTCLLTSGKSYESPIAFFQQNASRLEKGTDIAGKKVFRLGSYTMYPNAILTTIYKASRSLTKEAYNTLIDSPNWITAFSQYSHFVKLNPNTRLNNKEQIDVIKKFASLEYCMPNSDGSLPKSGTNPNYNNVPFLYDPNSTRNTVNKKDIQNAVDYFDNVDAGVDVRHYMIEAAFSAKYLYWDVEEIAGYIMHRPTKTLYVYNIDGKQVGYFQQASSMKFVDPEDALSENIIESVYIEKDALLYLKQLIDEDEKNDDLDDFDDGSFYPQA